MITSFLKIEDGWYEGLYKGRQGVFPSNYVTKADEPVNIQKPLVNNNSNSNSANNSTRIESPHLNNGVDNSLLSESADFADHKSKNNKKVIGIGFGNIFSGKQIELKTKDNFNNNSTNNLLNGSVKINSNSINGSTKSLNTNLQTKIESNENIIPLSRIKARVLYNYAPTQPDELKLVQGELIYILDKNLEDEGWWRGEIISSGKIGVFPEVKRLIFLSLNEILCMKL